MPKKRPFTAKELAGRKAFVERYARKSPQWWEDNMNLVFDGVTLTKPPRALTGRQKHAAQSQLSHAYRSEYQCTPSLGPIVRLKADPLAWARMGTDGCMGSAGA